MKGILVELIKFIFVEAIKVLGLVFLGVVATKSVAGLKRVWIKSAVYAVILGLTVLGAWYAGNDVAAEVYLWSSGKYLARGDVAKAYADALQAVDIRPNTLGNWGALVETKLRLGQVQSAMDDEPAVKALSNGVLDEADEYQFAVCSYYLGQYDNVVAATFHLTRQNPSYAAPYILQGLTYMAQQRYPEAQQSFTAILQFSPNNQAAVEGLAQAFYLAGDRQQALAVLDETQKFAFSPQARQKFAELKGLYAQ